MGVSLLPSSAFGIHLPHFRVASSNTPRGQFHLILGGSSNRKREQRWQSLLLKERPQSEEDEDAIYIVNGGRIDLLTDDDSQKWKLVSDGPRKEIPQWMARRIRNICPKFPPRKTDMSEALNTTFKSLVLPKPDEVWSIDKEKPKEGDMLIEHVMEKK
ncbi:hypothetical protein REPUB_Repub10bG0058500 [Reevesia pubescens]